MEGEPNKTSPSPSKSRAIKLLMIGIIIIFLAFIIALPILIKSSSKKQSNGLDSSSNQTVLNTTTIRTTLATTVRTSTRNTTTITLPRGMITHQYNENDLVYLACTNSMNITISYAFWGILSCPNCICASCTCVTMDITPAINSRCSNLTTCSFYAYSSIFGNPCPIPHETLIVTYYCT